MFTNNNRNYVFLFLVFFLMFFSVFTHRVYAKAVSFLENNRSCVEQLLFADKSSSIERAIKSMGYSAKTSYGEETKSPAVVVSLDNYNYVIFLKECGENKSCKSLEFTYVLNKKISLQQANEINSTVRFVTVVPVPSEEKFLVSMDVSVAGGISKETFSDVIANWITAISVVNEKFLTKK